MSTARHFDVIVIGTGPGGEGAAMMLAKSGRDVGVVEKYHDVGGGCTHWATIPSKALRHTVQRMADLRADPLFHRAVGAVELSYPDLLERAGRVIASQSNMRRGFYERNRTTLLTGHASLVDQHSVEVVGARGSGEQYSADHIIIATGSHPYRPPGIDFAHPRVHESDSVLSLTDTPRSVIIYGAGVIGCEYASIFANLGLKVDLVNTRDKLLAFLDDEITDALGYHLRNQGVVIRHSEEFDRVEPSDNTVVLHTQSGKKFRADIVLWANGRAGNTAQMNLEEHGIPVNHRGQLEVNENYQTKLGHVYAVGDVIGWPSLASASYDQGRVAATHIMQGASNTLRYFTETTFNYPTMAEAYRVAALNGLNRIF